MVDFDIVYNSDAVIYCETEELLDKFLNIVTSDNILLKKLKNIWLKHNGSIVYKISNKTSGKNIQYYTSEFCNDKKIQIIKCMINDDNELVFDSGLRSFYCVKNFGNGSYIKEGTIYYEQSDKSIIYSDSLKTKSDIEIDYYLKNILKGYLFEIENREAKIGEYVCMKNDMGGDLKPNTIHLCTSKDHFDDTWICNNHCNYFVLKGYSKK